MSPSLIQALSRGPLKVSIVGSGNWGSVVAKVVAQNAKKSHLFHDDVRMWVHEEMINGRKITDIINKEHENVRYLPGHKLPLNLIAIPNVVEACKNSDLLVFVLPHQFLERCCDELHNSGIIDHTTRAISLIKGVSVEGGYPIRLSKIIETKLNIEECCVLSGANVANDIAKESFSECTIGYKNIQNAYIWQLLFDKPYFKVNCVPDPAGVEVCGALKNIIALACGFCDGLNLGSNTKAAIMRIGINEMKNFATIFFDGILSETFLDSAGFADVVTTVYGGRNARVAAEFVRNRGKKSWEDLEKDMLDGQKLQGTLTAAEIYDILCFHHLTDYFPLFVTTYQIAFKGVDPQMVENVFRSKKYRNIIDIKDCTVSSLSTDFLPDFVIPPKKNFDHHHLNLNRIRVFSKKDINSIADSDNDDLHNGDLHNGDLHNGITTNSTTPK